VTSAGRASTGLALLAGLGLLAGCGGSTETTPTVTVQAGGDEITVDPTQYCLDGEGQRYSTTAPIIEVTPDTTIALTVSDAVAEAGWSVQVFDEELQETLGEVDVPAGEARFDDISTSDVVPPTFYLVVVEDADADECSGLSGAWPVGFIRTDGATATTPTPAG
jgi:hypothetical protein